MKYTVEYIKWHIRMEQCTQSHMLITAVGKSTNGYKQLKRAQSCALLYIVIQLYGSGIYFSYARYFSSRVSTRMAKR